MKFRESTSTLSNVKHFFVLTGIEVVKADMDDKASCQNALKGAYGVFLVTNYWETQDEEREVQQVSHLEFHVNQTTQIDQQKHILNSPDPTRVGRKDRCLSWLA